MTSLIQYFYKSRHILIYGTSMAILIFVLKWMQWKYLIADHSIDIYIGLTAIFFTALGIWIAQRLSTPKVKTLIVEKEVFLSEEKEFILNKTELEKLKLTDREYEVLQLLAQGFSNAQIAEKLFLSISTIKTHVSKLFTKLDVKSRFQAVTKAKRLNITQ